MMDETRETEAQRVALDTYVKLSRCLNAVNAAIAAKSPLPRGLTVSQFGVLEALLHKGPLGQNELGRKVLRSKGNMTMVLDHLERDGLVRRRRISADRRCYRVQLTEPGRKLIAGYFPTHASAVTEALSALTREEQRALGAACRKLGLGQRRSAWHARPKEEEA
jgi:MarR family 2-MHQ and catechol resistance regulon transcriptional repressor